MANNKEPIAKKCRSLDISPAVMGYGNKKSTRNPGGNKRKKVSEYGTQLKEKQKVKFVYGVLEKQFHRYYLKAANMKGITGENLLKLLELRLDNVIYRLGIAKTRRMARQIIVHGHILVNGKKVDIPSYSVKVGDVITLRERSREQAAFKALREGTGVVMGEHVWMDSEKLGWDDEVREVLKHGTLSVGFIGLAETLVALIGEHHGQSERAQQLGLKIIGHMRELCDKRSEEKKLNYTLLATPAEGLSGRFVKIDQKRYGRIAGVTDREYYTNSFHIPVYYPISAFDKIRLEAPYHALTNAGHISYIEMDGDPTKNLDAFEAVVRAMHDAGIGYGSINHPVDRDPVCGYNGIIGDSCPKCGRQEEEVHFERIRRITGYLVGTLERFNNGKRAEEHDRVKHGI